MGYRYHSRRARSRDLPVALCVSSFRVCVGRVSRLARVPFDDVWSRYCGAFDLGKRSAVEAAALALDAERDCWLGRHELFAAWKSLRRHRPPPAEVAAPLYRRIGADHPPFVPAGPAVYVVWRYRQSSGIGCRLIKKPPGYRSALQEGSWPWRVCGPFFGNELLAYLAFRGEEWRSRAENFVNSTVEEADL